MTTPRVSYDCECVYAFKVTEKPHEGHFPSRYELSISDFDLCPKHRDELQDGYAVYLSDEARRKMQYALTSHKAEDREEEEED